MTNNEPDPERLKELAAKWLNGTINEEEAREYAGWYNSDAGVPLNVDADFASSEEALRARMLSGIRNRMAQEKAVPFFRRPWLRYAAAVLVLISAYAYFQFQKPHRGNTKDDAAPALSAVVNDVAPGGNKAILTLSNGKQIVLDNAINGTLAQQGSTEVIKAADGSLVYDASGKKHHAATGYNTMATPRGGQYHITLSDGSQVWLNSESSITYPAAFTGNKRTVQITGEAYFEIAKDPARPFIAKLPDRSQITVLGTHFNVNAYSDEPAATTTLLEGAVSITNGADKVLLKPGYAATLGAAGRLQVVKADVDQAVAWKNGVFQFENASLETVMRQLARWYDVDVVYEGKIPSDRFVGKLPRDASALQVLNALESMQVHFRIEGKKIIVEP